MIHRFGPVTVDEERREVRRGEQAVAPQPLHLDVLLYLMRHRDRTVSRGELHEQFWDDTEWPDRAIDSCLAGIRRLLRESNAAIRSSYGRGVRFLGPAAAQGPAGTPAMTAVPSGELLGRGGEMAQVSAALDDLLAGHGAVALIAGEAGIGKTRLAEELVRHARLRGADATVATCRGDAPPFAPWRDMLESYAAGRDAQDLRATLGSAADELGRIAPSLAAGAPTVNEASETESARDRLVGAMAGFLGRAAHRHPIVLLLDDIHLADSSSLVLLQRIAQVVTEDPVLIAATYRDPNGNSSPGWRATLDTLRHLPRLVQVEPGPLTSAESRRLIERLSGGAAPAALIGDIESKAEGNPFFVGEYWRHLAADRHHGAERGTASGALAVPSTIDAVLGLRLERVNAPCRAMLDAASVIGREFEDGVLAESCDLSAAELLDALEEATDQRIVVPVRGAPNRYRFVHALIREAAYGRLAEDRRSALHGRAAACLEHREVANPGTALAELAHHFGQAGEPDKAIAFATRAGEQAYAMLAYEDAARYFELALVSLEAHRPAQALRSYDLLLALGDARANAGDAAGAAAAYARADADRPLMFPLQAAPQPALTTGDAALTAHAHLVSRFEFFMRMSDDPLFEESWPQTTERRQARHRMALANARRAGNRAALADALSESRWLADGPRFLGERLRLSTELIEVAEDIGAIHLAQEGRLFRIQDLLERGRATAVHATIDTFARVAERRPEPMYAWALAYLRAMQAAMATRLEEAERHANDALELGLPVVGELAHVIFGMQIGVIRGGQGRMPELADVCAYFASQHPQQLVPRVTLLAINCQLGRFDEARRELDFMAEGGFARIEARPVTWLNSILSLVVSCAALADRARAAQLYRMLRPMAGCCATFPLGAAFFGAVDGYLGILAATMRRWNDAAAYFESGMALNERMGSPGTVAQVQIFYARMLLEKGGRAADRRARELLAAATAIAGERNLPGLLTVFDSLR